MEHELLTILEGCKQKQPIAQRQLYEYCYIPLCKVVQRYINDAEKVSIVVNDAMLKVFKNLATYQHDYKFLAWVKQIAVNTSIDYVRIKSNMRVAEQLNETAIQEHSIEAEILEKIDSDAVLQFINQLPVKFATVFNLYVYEEYDHAEISQILQIPVGTSRYYLSEARKQLKTLIETNFFSLNKTATNE